MLMTSKAKPNDFQQTDNRGFMENSYIAMKKRT